MASVEQTTQQALYGAAGSVPAVPQMPQAMPQAIPQAQMMAAATKARPRVSTTLWEDENTLCFQVEARGISVARREDNDMINGTKLLNVAGMTRGRRDGMLKAEKDRRVVKIGAMHLKGVWIPFDRAMSFAQKEGIADVLFPLFVDDIRSYLYRQTNPAGAEIPLALPTDQKYQSPSGAKSSVPASSATSQASQQQQQQQSTSQHTTPQPQQALPTTQQQYSHQQAAAAQQLQQQQYPQSYMPQYNMQGSYGQPLQSNYPQQYSSYPAQMMYAGQQQQQQTQPQAPTQQEYQQQMYYPQQQQGFPSAYDYQQYYNQKKDGRSE